MGLCCASRQIPIAAQLALFLHPWEISLPLHSWLLLFSSWAKSPFIAFAIRGLQ
jgi:hypothetical protein